MKKNDGGQAFPSPGVTIDRATDQECINQQDGMTLRDYFAAQAMQALLMTINEFPNERLRNGVAFDAYLMAHAMLEVRKYV